MFFSGNGIHLERGVSESNSLQAAFKERVIANAENVVLLADHSKLGQKAAFFFSEVADITCLITDRAADKEFIENIREQGIEVLQGD
jgi:DeoR/GlpR family transcriptional regulator of sugar metabolism